MAKGTRGRRGIASRQCRPTPYSFLFHNRPADVQQKNCCKAFEKDWEDATCSVCMECPHNAVLLLCSSYEKGCRPYMCGTSFRYSNCLDQYKKAYTKETSSDLEPVHDSVNGHVMAPLSHRSLENLESVEQLTCPLCRGQVKGWTVVQAAREHLNAKTRSCMQDNCLFIGTYKELRKHVKGDHPSAKPREVDPNLEQKWKRLEYEREREDVISTIRSSMPGAVIFGDYVIEGSHYDSDSEDEDEDEDSFDADAMQQQNRGMEVGVDQNLMSMVLFLQAFGSSAGNAGSHRGTRLNSRDSSSNRNATRLNQENTVDAFDSSEQDSDSREEDENSSGASLGSHVHRQGRVLLGRSGRGLRGSGEHTG